MGLKDRVRESMAVPVGFQFARPEFRAFANVQTFRQALHDQEAATELIDADAFARMDVDGRVLGIEEDALRLTKAAFGQLCHLCRLPVSYVESLSCRDEALAMDVVAEALRSMLHRDERKVMVVDTRTKVVHAFIDRESYDVLPNETILDLAMSAGRDIEMTRGFLDGPNVRVTVVDRTNIVAPKLGDVVRMGTDLTTNLGAENLIAVHAYNERLKCANGMVVRERGSSERVSARHDVAAELPDVMVRSINQGALVGPLMQKSANTVLDEAGIGRMTTYLSDPKTGGNRRLVAEVVASAQREARDDQRDENELTVWDFVNGVTEAARNSRTLNRRVDLEGMGYKVMAEFVGWES